MSCSNLINQFFAGPTTSTAGFVITPTTVTPGPYDASGTFPPSPTPQNADRLIVFAGDENGLCERQGNRLIFERASDPTVNFTQLRTENFGENPQPLEIMARCIQFTVYANVDTFDTSLNLVLGGQAPISWQMRLQMYTPDDEETQSFVRLTRRALDGSTIDFTIDINIGENLPVEGDATYNFELDIQDRVLRVNSSEYFYDIAAPTVMRFSGEVGSNSTALPTFDLSMASPILGGGYIFHIEDLSYGGDLPGPWSPCNIEMAQFVSVQSGFVEGSYADWNLQGDFSPSTQVTFSPGPELTFAEVAEFANGTIGSESTPGVAVMGMTSNGQLLPPGTKRTWTQIDPFAPGASAVTLIPLRLGDTFVVLPSDSGTGDPDVGLTYEIVVTGTDNASWTYEINHGTAGFTIEVTDYVECSGGPTPPPPPPPPPSPPPAPQPPGVALDLNKLAYNEYSFIRNRGQNTPIPNYIFVNGDYPTREIKLWPVPRELGLVELWLWQPLDANVDLDEPLIMPPGYERALKYNLAVELAPEYGRDASPIVEANARTSRAMVQRLQVQPIRARLSKSIDNRHDGDFNWITGQVGPDYWNV